MKKKYTLTVANSQIDIVTEENKETIDSIVGIVDRKIREVYLHSKGECSRTNAAILVCLDYCAEKMDMQKALKNANAQIDRLTSLNELAEKEKAALEREIEALRATINANAAPKAVKKAPVEQIAFDDINIEEASADENIAPAIVDESPTLIEALTPPSEASEEDKPHVKLKKKMVRAMFDNIAFDDI